MKKQLYSVSLALAIIGVSLSIFHPALALTSAPDVEAEATGPSKATVLWNVPTEADEGGTETVASWELDLADNFSFTDATTFGYSAETLTANLTSDDGLKSISHFYVRVRAVYTDTTYSSYTGTNFYTMIGKIKNLRVADKTTSTATLQWDKPARQGDTLQYDVKVYHGTNLVLDDSVYGKSHLDITDLIADRKYYFKVRGRQDSKYGIGKWSEKKYFRMAE